uniref:Odorant receptor n=1 Tax=Dendrolimus punctatus TaxID=238572 RepID=A0A2K8GL36_9NEOP|nr:Odorant Receptor 27-2 [Dendrolimus punctatus]
MSKISDIFNPLLFQWKLFAIWPGKTPSRLYKYYTYLYLFATLFAYNILLTVNLIYTPFKIDMLIREVIFNFTEIVVTSKVIMVLVKRNKIVEILDLLDSEEFQDTNESSSIVGDSKKTYTRSYLMYAITSNISYFSQVIAPVFVNLIFGSSLTTELPICNYYFLSDESRKNYFVFWFIYQAVGMYGHMTYNVTIDSFLAGLLLMTETQMRVINYKLTNLNKEVKHGTDDKANEDKEMSKLKKCLRHYDLVLKYCSQVQNLINVTIFIQFGIGSVIICVTLCALLLPSKMETMIFMVTYFMAMTMQIFVPGWLGTKIRHESQQLVFAAYNTDWISRSKSFKRNIMIFVERANIPIQMTGLKMFPLSLVTFTSIMKTAYSLFTLIRNVQEPDVVKH